MADPVTQQALTTPVPASVCAQMVETATRSCPTVTQSAPEAQGQNLDAVAAAIASQANAISWGALAIAVIVALAGIAWARLIAAEAKEAAEKEAKAIAKKCADEYMEKWASDEAYRIVRERVDFILNATLGDGSDTDAADGLGEDAG